MTIKYNNVFIEDAYTICGNYENDGPLSKYFDHKVSLIKNMKKIYTLVKNLGSRLKYIY